MQCENQTTTAIFLQAPANEALFLDSLPSFSEYSRIFTAGQLRTCLGVPSCKFTVFMCVRTCACKCVSVSRYVDGFLCMCFTCACTCLRACVYLKVRVFACVLVCLCTSVYVCVVCLSLSVRPPNRSAQPTSTRAHPLDSPSSNLGARTGTKPSTPSSTTSSLGSSRCPSVIASLACATTSYFLCTCTRSSLSSRHVVDSEPRHQAPVVHTTPPNPTPPSAFLFAPTRKPMYAVDG